MSVDVRIELRAREPFDVEGTLRFLAARAIDGVEAVDFSAEGQLRYARALVLPNGPAAVEVTFPSTASALISVRLELSGLDDAEAAVALVRRTLDLDADAIAIDAALGTDPLLAPLVAAVPGIRVPGAVGIPELLVRAIVGQQISVVAARTHLTRLVQAAGSSHASSIRGLTRRFPTPAQILAAVPEPDPDEPPDPGRPLRLPAQSIRAVRAAMQACADGRVDSQPVADPARLRSQLMQLPRVGPWTAAYVAMRGARDPDAWLDGDVALIAGARTAGILPESIPRPAAHRLLAQRATAWRPWRSYAAMHLWRGAANDG